MRAGPCETRSCGDRAIGCLPVVPCDANACIVDGMRGLGCATVGEECQTHGCDFEEGPLFVSTDAEIWTDWSELHYRCLDDICDVGVEYCNEHREAGTAECLPLPDGCSSG